MLCKKQKSFSNKSHLKSASIAPPFLLGRLQRYSFQLVIQLVFPSYTLQLPSICVAPTAFKTLCSNKLGILTGTSWHFSDMSSNISARWAHESTSLDVNKANGMLTSNAKRIFCKNVTCFARSKKVAWIWSHLQECLKCSSLLAFNGTAFNLFSNESFPHTPYGFPLSVPCRLLLRHSVRTSWDFSLEQVGISPKCQVKYLLGGCMKSTSLNVNKANGMLTSNANSSFPTLSRALEQVNAARIGVICECFNCSSLLACKATVELSICYPIGLSRIHLAASLYLCPADCFQDILFEQAGNSHWNKLAFLRYIKWHICSVGARKYLTWCQ